MCLRSKQGLNGPHPCEWSCLPTNCNDNHREIDLNEYGLQLYFAQDYEVLGETKTIELKPGGGNIPVTEENKEEYVE